MQCELAKCQWNGFGSCCPESEEMFNAIKPNNVECPSFKDLEADYENARIAYIAYLLEILVAVRLFSKEQLKKDIPTMTADQLLDIGEKLESLYQSQKTSEALDGMLLEIKEIGPEAFKAKHNLT